MPANLPTSPRSERPTAPAAYELYLDLMKRCLIDSIYLDDPLAHYMLYREKDTTKAWKHHCIRLLQRFLDHYRLRLVEPTWFSWNPDHANMDPAEKRALRETGLGWSTRAHTFISLARLDNIQYCVETALRDGVPGDLIETGVWRGGACIFMRGILKAHGDTTRKVWLADSFKGLPPPNADDYPADTGGQHHEWAFEFAVSRQVVEENFRRYGLLDDQVRFLEGWFKDTLPGAPIEKLAVMRLDGDMYESTMQALESLYDRLSPGGFVIVDDYFLPPCAKAVHDFRDARGIADEILNIDDRGCYWRRSM